MVNSSRCGAGSGSGDFMSAVTSAGQAMQVMTQGFLGGRLLGKCNVGGGQSEHMAFVMPEAHQNRSAPFDFPCYFHILLHYIYIIIIHIITVYIYISIFIYLFVYLFI